MKIISRLIGMVVLKSIALAILIIVGLDATAEFIDESKMIKNNYGVTNVFEYVFTTLPSSISEYFPFAVLIGCLFGIGQLSSSNELIVIRASGISKYKIFWFALKPVLLLVLLVSLSNEFITPYLDQKAEGNRDYLRKGSSFQTSVDGLWINDGDQFINVSAVFPGGVLYGVSRYTIDSERRLSRASFASRAVYNESEKLWVEENLSITIINSSSTSTENFVTKPWISDLTPEILTINFLPPEALAIRTLGRHIDFLDKQNTDTTTFLLPFLQKLFNPLLVVTLTLIAVGTAMGPLRDSTRGYRLFLGVVFGVSLKIVQDLLGSFTLVYGYPIILGVTIPICLCLLVGFILNRAR